MEFTKKVVLVVCAAAIVFCATGKANASALPSAENVQTGAAAITIWTTSARAGAGKSGPAIMKALANGAIVGKGVAIGAATLGSAAGLAGAEVINNTLLRDDASLSDSERNARSAGRTWSYAGAAVGAVSTYVTVTTMGSGAGIASSLTAIGATFGGGMATGAVTIVAAPAAIAVAVGVGVYGVVKLVDWAWN